MYRSLDYDLLILGASAGGLEAALLALQDRSRVGLLTLGLPLPPETIASLESLQQAGLDVIKGSGYFLPKDRGFQATERSKPLRSRAYLLALPAVPLIPNLPRLATTPYYTAIPLDTHPANPEHWLILGEGLGSVEDCYALRESGHQVTLLLQAPLRSALAQRLQQDLEGQGVDIFNSVQVLAVDREESQIRVTAPQGTWQGEWIGDRLLVSQGKQPAPLDLNLQALHPQIAIPLQVKPSLQSVFAPHLYGCGIVLGGLALDSLARYEARIAVPNALYFNHRVRRYDCIPYRRLSNPWVTQLGWTLETASNSWDRSSLRSVEIAGFWDSPHQAMPKGSLLSPYLQVLFDRHGQILGAQGIGHRSAQALQVLALARQHRHPWPHLLRSLPGGEVADLLYSIQSRLMTEFPKAPVWESFFNWRRTGYW